MSKANGALGSALRRTIPTNRSGEYQLMPSIHVCERAKPHLVILVTTAPGNRKARQAIRETWGGEIQVRGQRVMTLFVVGYPLNPVIGKELIEEAKEHGDLIQGHFIDTYTNLTLKTTCMLAWVQRFCPQAHYVAKVDDDVMFNPSALLQYLNFSFKNEQIDLYLGRVHMKVAPDRNPASRHFLSEMAFTGTVLPDYCSGTAYVLSQSALLKLSAVALTFQLPNTLPPEDVFMGICAQAAGISPTHSPLFSGGPAVPYSRCCYQTMVSVHHTKPQEMMWYWMDMRSRGPCSWLKMRTSFGVCKLRALLGTLLRKDW
ncbi:hypothetical protein DNTS_003550 [Danionella cerebrum]|uniref:Hexosyltransferase n=1 Tax=Danionella cerebrum TaxID=2873325 RepID=A0A553QZM6_9TELE|nr:hypothetical protein DNTS_003550 [Danionella translucida]